MQFCHRRYILAVCIALGIVVLPESAFAPPSASVSNPTAATTTSASASSPFGHKRALPAASTRLPERPELFPKFRVLCGRFRSGFFPKLQSI
jgi:hypothetical protein